MFIGGRGKEQFKALKKKKEGESRKLFICLFPLKLLTV